MPRIQLLPCSLLLIACISCQPATFEESSDEAGDGDGETGDGDGDATGDGDGDSGDGDPTFNCDPTIDMACPEGQKCTALSSGGGPPVYDCVTDDTDKLPYEACTPAPATGQDGCPSGHTCIAPPDSNAGVCMPLCTEDTDCDAALCTTPANSQVLVCAAICDPLAPLCPDLQDCQRVRKSNFVCEFPFSDDNGTTAEPCNAALDVGCAEGFVCETGGIIPGCVDSSCCTALCDRSEADPCMAPMICGELPLDPQPGLENVGACYVPQ